ncbi:MAG: molybdopterin molybdotransferase MoeA [Alphaproteobacteria bacterium]|nr:molybdopterin molybdotransferase MoeA [Alphaproteobacteria bacterium]
MLPVDEARARVLATVVPLPSEPVPVLQALDRVLAADVVATVDVPPWDNSAMDGYAVRSADLGPDGGALTVLEVVPAGRAPTVPVTTGTTTVVMTGAPMPEGADAVVVVEDSDGARSGTAHLTAGATPGRYVRRRGADVARGATVLARGTTLGPAHLGLIASVGQSEVDVVRRPCVAILTTGDEVVRAGGALGPGQIHGSNHLTLAGLVVRAGGTPIDAGHVGDDPAALVAALDRALDADVVLTTGGVSVGDHDHVKDALAAVGIASAFWKVRMKPGKPLAFGTAARDGRTVPVFGLPGNPVSCMVNFLQFARPWLRAAMGDPTPHLPIVDATCADDLRSRPGRARLERVVLHRPAAGDDPSGWTVTGTGDPSSGVLTSMARAHGLVLIGPDEAGPCPGDRVRVQLLDASFLDRPDVAFGW